MRTSFVLLFIASMLAGCGEPAVEADGGTDAGPTTCDAIPPFETGDPEGHAEPLGAGPGEARAGRLEASELPADRTGLATWAEGDFVLASDRVALIIEDVGDSDLYDPYGGRPVGIARVEGGALVEAGDFNEIIFGFGAYLVVTESVTVMNDGSDGHAAVVRASGPLGPLEFAGDLLTGLLPGDFTGMPGALDYTMEPGSSTIDVTLHVSQPGQRGVRPPLLTGLFQRYRMPMWTPESGFASTTGDIAMAAFIDDEGTSYAWLPPEGQELSLLVDQSGVLVYKIPGVPVPACETVSIPLGSIALGGPGLPGLQRELARERGETLRTITGTVVEADGSPATDVRVHVRRADGTHFARVTPAADGTFSVDVPSEAVSFFAYREGTSVAGPVEAAADATSVALTMPAFATITVDVAEAGTDPRTPIPARVQVIPSAGAPVVPADFGERDNGGNGRAHVAFTSTGSIALRVDPGEHEVVISRGYEYELHTETVAVAAGETASVSADLEHVVQTPGVMCADYHIHTHRSPDSPDSPRLKLLGLIADGLEIAIRSDHEWINDFTPLIEEMGLTPYAFGISGEELTTFKYGHFGVFPIYEDRSRPNAGAVSWIGRLPPDAFDDARARPEAPALIINHPRSGGALGGYFSAAGFDPVTGTASRAEYWDDEFALVEVFNDGDFEQYRDSVVADWFGLIRSGRRVFAVGSSDSHNIYGAPVGYPRTCLALGTDDPTALTPDMVRDVTEAGHSVVSGGLYLTVVGPDGSGPGDEVSGVGATAMFEVTVQAASWIEDVNRLEVIVDGTTTETIPITPGDTDPTNPAIRLHTTEIAVPVAAEGSWVVFHAAADGDLAPVHPGRRPFAVSNPVFLRR